MDDEELNQKESPDQDLQSNAGNVVNKAESLGKQGLSSLQGLGGASEAEAGAAAGETAGVAGEAGGAATTAGLAEGGAAAGAAESGALAGGAAATGATITEGAAGGAIATETVTGTVASGSAGAGFGPALAIVLIVVVGFTFITTLTGKNPTSDAGTTTNPVQNPIDQTPLPQTLTFNGGDAYISCDKNTIANCPSLSKGQVITIYITLHITNKQFIESPEKVLVDLTVDAGVLSELKYTDADPTYFQKVRSSTNDYFVYKWKLNSLKDQGGGAYQVAITESVIAESGTSNLSLFLEGVGKVTGHRPIPL